MFTGISTNTGTIKNITKGTNSQYLIESNMSLTNIKIGSSILCSGICLTVTKKMNNKFLVNISEETLKVTTASNWKIGSQLNLEKSLKYGDKISGHFIQGHVDTTGIVKNIRIIDKHWILDIKCKSKFKKYLIEKGSISINGVSLTINKVLKDYFQLSIIPHTLKLTNLINLKQGSIVNIEFDIFNKYYNNLSN